jgi:predicted tellurium resistance membrane protein TerC
MRLTEPIFTLFSNAISGRDLILLVGGLFLLGKSTHEIHNSLEGPGEDAQQTQAAGFASILIQIAILDIVFSLDSVITAVGLARHVQVMVIAVVISVLVMMASARALGAFVDRHPTIKMLALSFLILIGFTLLGEGLDLHIPKGYVYFAMAFSVAVEMLNLRMRARREAEAHPVQLHKTLHE